MLKLLANGEFSAKEMFSKEKKFNSSLKILVYLSVAAQQQAAITQLMWGGGPMS